MGFRKRKLRSFNSETFGHGLRRWGNKCLIGNLCNAAAEERDLKKASNKGERKAKKAAKEAQKAEEAEAQKLEEEASRKDWRTMDKHNIRWR